MPETHLQMVKFSEFLHIHTVKLIINFKTKEILCPQQYMALNYCGDVHNVLINALWSSAQFNVLPSLWHDV